MVRRGHGRELDERHLVAGEHEVEVDAAVAGAQHVVLDGRAGARLQQVELACGRGHRPAELAPRTERVAVVLVDALAQDERGLAAHRQGQLEAVLAGDVVRVGAADGLPREDGDTTVGVGAHEVVVAAGEHVAAHPGHEGVEVVGRLGDLPVREQPEPAVEERRRDVRLLEDVAERPVGERVGEVAATGEDGREVGRVVGRVVDGVVRPVGGVELRDVDREAGQRGALEVAARHPELGEQLLRRHERLVDAEGDLLRRAGRVRVPGDEVDRHVTVGDEVRERLPPLVVRAAADGRPTDLEVRVDVLDRARRLLVEAEVRLLVGVLPEDREVRLVPHLDRPAAHLLDAVAVDLVAQQRLDEGGPLAVVPRRRDVALPPEDRLVAGRELRRHEPELEERPDADREEEVVHLVDVRERVPGVRRAVDGVGAQHAHVVREQTVPADVPEADLLLHPRERVAVVGTQGEVHAAGADAGAPGVGQRSGGPGGDDGAHGGTPRRRCGGGRTRRYVGFARGGVTARGRPRRGVRCDRPRHVSRWRRRTASARR